MGLISSIWGASSQASAARQAAAIMANASNGAAQATMNESDRGSDDIRSGANAAANSIEQAGNTGRETILNAGNRSGEGTINAGAQGRDSILDSLKGLDQYSSAGSSALSRLTDGMKEGGEFSHKFEFDKNMMNDAGVQYRIANGTKALESSAASKGLIGGNLVKSIEANAQGEASSEFNNSFGRQLTSYNTNRAAMMDPLNNLAKLGLDANGQRTAGTTAASQLDVNAHAVGGNAFTDAAKAGTNAAMTGVQSAGDFRTRADTQASLLRADATKTAGLFRQDGASALAAGKVGSANAFVNGLSGSEKALQQAIMAGFGGG